MWDDGDGLWCPLNITTIEMLHPCGRGGSNLFPKLEEATSRSRSPTHSKEFDASHGSEEHKNAGATMYHTESKEEDENSIIERAWSVPQSSSSCVLFTREIDEQSISRSHASDRNSNSTRRIAKDRSTESNDRGGFPVKKLTYKMKKKTKVKRRGTGINHSNNVEFPEEIPLCASPVAEMLPLCSNPTSCSTDAPTGVADLHRRTTSDSQRCRLSVSVSKGKSSGVSFPFLRQFQSSLRFMLVLGFACFLVITNLASVNGDLVGGVVTVPLVLDRIDTPYYIRDDVIIAESGELIIKPGVQLLFSPTVGITVFGRLIAEGTETDRILMSSATLKVPSQIERLSNFSSTTYLDNRYSYNPVQYSTITEHTPVAIGPSLPAPTSPLSTSGDFFSNFSAANIQHNNAVAKRAINPKDSQDMPSVRLVEGPTPLMGRLQVYHRGRWRSVCTNSRNWTLEDMQTACRELGFSGGEFWIWVDHLNDTKQALWERPQCQGLESHLKDCPNWAGRQLGSGVCDHHPNLGIRCEPFHLFPSKVEQHWRGIRFENARYRETYIHNNTLRIKESLSFLSHVDIFYAGVGTGYNVTSAIESVGVPPVVRSSRIEYSAYNGINFTNPGSVASIRNCTVKNNAGFGIYVNSSWSGFEIDSSHIEANGADGIRYVFHDTIPDSKLDGMEWTDLCTVPITINQIYPARLSLDQSSSSNVEKKCRKRFQVRSGYVLTMHFPYLMSQVDNAAEILVYDGMDSRGNLLTTIKVKNETWPQSVTSTRDSIYVEYKADPLNRVLVIVDLVAGQSRDYELKVQNSVITKNNGRGIAVENIRSQVIVLSSSVKENSLISGVHVLGGVGHVNVSRSEIISNVGDGLNITYGGGVRNISRSIIASNTRRGIAVWFNESSVKLACEQETIVEYTEISRNLDMGIFVGNFCGSAVVNISGNLLKDGKRPSIVLWSCWHRVVKHNFGYPLKIQIGHNRFVGNDDFGIRLHPLVNAYAMIEHNYFLHQSRGCLVIKGVDLKELETLVANVEVSNNVFEKNTGIFVASLGLNHYSKKQNLLFTQNFIRWNTITEPYATQLNPRSRVAAPVVISSANVDVFRNILQNPDSKYEIGSHMTDQSFVLNCTFNWLGSKEEKDIYYRIFDRKDRFNLAKIDFIPFLLSPTDPNTEIAMTMRVYVPVFDRPDRMIGGEITGRESLISGEYKVVRDISIRPGGQLQIAYGVTLKFLPSVGIMVGGHFHAEGSGHSDGNVVKFTLFDPGRVNATDAPVRLVGGRTRKEGRLQVRIGNTWGSVCNYGFGISEAAVACRQMGLVLNPHDCILERIEIPQANPSEQIVMSKVECSEWDHDLTKCEGDTAEDIENSCTHENVVGIRCYDPAWAGIRTAITSEKSVMKFAVVEKAGLLDPQTNEMIPAVQLDFSHHVLHDIRVSDNIGDGLGIIYSDLYFPDNVNVVERSEFSRNLGNGILLRQLGLQLKDCQMEHNRGAGILHDPFILRSHQREIAGWVTVGRKDRIEYFPLPGKDLWLDENTFRFIITKPEYPNVNEVYNVIAQDQNFVISIQLLNPFHNESTEEMLIYDRHDIPAKEGVEYFQDIEVWSVRRDQVSFPTVSSSYGVTVWFRSGAKPRGNMILLIRAIRAPISRFARSRLLEGPLPKLKVYDSKLRYNGRGLAAIHYNRYENEDGDLYLRKSNESIEIFGSEIAFNQGEAIHVFTPYREIYSSNISEVTFMINSTTITDNRKGIVQYSKDLRSSNNLYRWVLRDNVIERNKEGGFQVSLPYVWQYDENHTHFVHVENVTFRNNENFEVHIAGHFSVVNVLGSLFEQNLCKNGLFSLTGMEKQMFIFGNQFLNNQGSYMVQFDTDSQSEIVGQVLAYFVRNQVQHNRITPGLRFHQKILNNATYQPMSYALGLKGHQKINVTKNLFGSNDLDYELLAGTKTAKLDNNVNVIQNWWGTSDPKKIRERIFDFDDWNSYAIASYRPYLLRDDFEAPFSTSYEPENEVTIDNLAGRLMHPLTLYKRGDPYVVKSDLTIMPNAMLSISPGVEIEFYPSVGILALGTLIAQGRPESPIIMRPITLQKKEEIDFLDMQNRGRSGAMDDKTRGVRLCIEEKCQKGVNEGFLEYFNRTTLQWVPMCDDRFTERNVQVICRQLGFDHLNVHFDFGRRWEYMYNHNPVTRVRKWPEPFQCVGDEKSLDDCPVRMNGQLYGYDYPCHWENDFIFIQCGARNLNKTMEYWGGIRFGVPDFEQHLFEHRMHDAVTHNSYQREESVLEWVEMYGAGILHNEKSPAVLSIMQSPFIRYVNITKSASHAISIVSSPRTMRITKNYIGDNMGLGIAGLSLMGEAQYSDSSSFFPLRKIEIPYGLFGMVDVCDTNKEIIVEERVVLYYKYDNFPVDCVKIFKSVYNAKNLGFRLLQFNLFNSTGKPWPADYIKLIDGDIYNITTEEMATITMGDEPTTLNKFHTTSWPSLSIKLHATGATEYHGFVAEILTLPVSPHGLDRNIQHNVSYTIFHNNSRGAFYYGSAGEISPTVTLERNRFEYNCLKFYGNFTSCESPIRFDVQNMQHIYFRNNVVKGNQGGLRIVSDSSGSPTALKGYVHNNVFENNTNNEIIHVEGKRSSPYQEIIFYRNIITRNDANFKEVVTLSQVVSNLTDNYFHANRGKHIMEVSGFEKVRLPIYQSCVHNSFYMNVATDIEDKATIIAGSTGQQYVDNILVNPENSYELATVNKSRPRAIQSYEWNSAVDARHNWWGYPGLIPVMGRIKDENDNIDLLRVLFDPFRIDNRTLLSGKCPPGYTLVADTCYMYIGGYMTFAEAKDFCRNENASMPYVESNFYTVIHFLRGWQEEYDYYDRVWVQDVDRFGKCTVFVAGTVTTSDCTHRLPFICETDPKVSINPFAWTTDSVTIGALIGSLLALILIVFMLVFWYSKSRHRKVERLERRNSIRASIRSSRSFTSMSALSEAGYRRRVAEIVSSQKNINQPQPTDLNNYNKMNGSFDSIEKTPSAFTSLDTTSYDFYETQSQNQNTGVSTAANSEFEDFSRHPMGRPRPRPSNTENNNGIHGLPVVPPQVPPGQYRHKALVHQAQTQHQQQPTDTLGKPSFDLSFENQNFRETPSMTSMQPSDYWDSSARLQSNGNAVKYKNTNVPPSPIPRERNLPRSISMATTMPLAQQSMDNFPDLDNSDPNNMNNNSNMLSHPPSQQDGSLHQIGLPIHNFSRSPQHYPPPHHHPSSASPYHPMATSQSFDQLELERLDQYDQYNQDDTYRPNIVGSLHRPSETEGAAQPDSSPATTASIKDSSPSSTHRRGGATGDMTEPNSYSSGSHYLDSPKLDASDDKNRTGSRKARVIETSLDDLEVDYELDETNVRPVSTYLETNVDDALLPPIRSARSQYIPTTSGSGGGSSIRGAGPAARRINHQQRMAHQDDEFKALSARSKSMPLETEM